MAFVKCGGRIKKPSPQGEALFYLHYSIFLKSFQFSKENINYFIKIY